MTIVNLPSVIGAKSLEDVIDAVENMRKTVEYLLENVQDDNINGIISSGKISIGADTTYADGYNPSILSNNFQTQIDGKIDIWFYNGVPGSTVDPEKNWKDDTTRNSHVGDLYYDLTTKYCYRYKVENTNVFSWERIMDSDIQSAMDKAAGAQDTADHKRRVFVNTPIPPYDVGDLWAEGGTGDLKRCNTARKAGDTYNVDTDFGLATKYTDDTVANAALSATSGFQDQLDGKVEVWYYAGAPTSSNAPASSWTDNATKDKHVGDLYYDTATKYAYRYKADYTWEKMQDQDIGFAMQTAGTKKRIFTSTPQPPYDKGDLWVGTIGSDIKYCSTARASGSMVSTDWTPTIKGTYIDDKGVYTGDLVASQIKTGTLTSIELSSVTGDFAGKLSADILTVEPPNGKAAIMKFKAGMAGTSPQYVTFAGNVVSATDLNNNVTYSSYLMLGKNWNSTQNYMSSNMEFFGVYANNIDFYGTLNMNNHNIEDVNHITISDTGPYEGIEWVGGSGWVIHETDDSGLENNAAYPLQFFNNSGRMVTFGTTGNIFCTGTTMKIQNNKGYFKSDGDYTVLYNDVYGTGAGVGNDGRDRFYADAIYARTYTSGTVACQVTNQGTLGILSSAQRYKLDIQDVPLDMPNKILNMNPRMWFDKTASEAYADYLTKTSAVNPDGTPNQVEDVPIPDFPDIERSYGLIAEELEAAGLSEFVIYSKDENGNKQTQSIAYDRLWTMLIPIVKELKDKVSALEAQLIV